MLDDLDTRIRVNQQKLLFEMKPRFDFIVCGSGSSGAVVARRLAENPAVSVLLLEAGGSDDIAEITNASSWPALRNAPQNWMFKATANPQLNGRAIPMAMGKVLGGGASINVMSWSRGHKNDWDYFSAEVGDEGWNYQSVLAIYRRVEDWHGSIESALRGRGGMVFVQPSPDPSPFAKALLDAFAAAGVPTSADQRDMTEGDGGAALNDICVRDGRRQSVFRAYVYPWMDRPNLTVMTDALVTRLVFDGHTTSGVEVLHGGRLHFLEASREVVVSLGAIHTPKLLMHSGIGDETILSSYGIHTLQHLPGVGRNFQDHFMAPCVWESPEPLQQRNNLGEVTAIWKSDAALATPDLQTFSVSRIYSSPEAARPPMPAHGWSLTTAVLRPASRGRLNLMGRDPADSIAIDANFLDDPDDRRRLRMWIAMNREIGNSAPLRPFVKREVLPGADDDASLDAFMRNATVSHSHQSGTAKMGRDSQAVVDGRLRVYGIDRLRVADASVMPRITAGNTMAPCVVIGERAAEMLKIDHGI